MSERDPIARPPIRATAKSAHGTARAGSKTTPLYRNALVVSVHDVCPGTRDACERILVEMAQLGVNHCSLLVVPNHHGHGHFLEAPDFCGWLEEKVKDGHELVIHGYHHQRARRGDESLTAKLTTRIYTADEGEFYDLSREEAAPLIAAAQEEFRQAGFEADGFIAPAWLLSGGAEAALREQGCQYTTRLGGVLDLQTDETYKSQSLVWSVRSGWRRQMSLAWNALLFRSLAGNPLLRVAIHPVDLDHPAIWQQVRELIARALADRVALTYERWLRKQRAMRAVHA